MQKVDQKISIGNCKKQIDIFFHSSISYKRSFIIDQPLAPQSLERISTNLNKEKFSFFDINLNQVFKKPNYFAFW